jgi:uncharacterized protein YbjQ (UPF0145 family)
MNELLDKHWAKIIWVFGTLTVSGGLGSYALKGYTAEAVQEANSAKNIIIEQRNNEIKQLEREIDKLQTNAIVIGFRYDMCCAGNPCGQ